MLLCMYYVDDAYRRLCNARTKLEDYAKTNVTINDPTVENLIKTVNRAFWDMVRCAEESREFCSDANVHPLLAFRSIAPIVEDRLNNVTDINGLVSTVKMITDPFDTWIESHAPSYVSYYSYSSEFREYWSDYGDNRANISVQAAAVIDSSITWPTRQVNIFDMFCKPQSRILNMTREKDNVHLFGLDTQKSVKYDDRKDYHRIIYGNLKGSFISNDSFDIAICLPYFTKDKNIKMGVIVRNERDMLHKAGDYLQVGGILIYAIPYYRFNRDICEYLVKNYDDIQIFTTTSDMDYSCRFVYVIGKRAIFNSNREFNQEVFDKLIRLPLHHSKDDILFDPVKLNPITLPNSYVEVRRFRGSELNEEEISELYASSKCTSMFWKDQQVEKLGETKARPLLPFNVGQLGLVLTSGCLDGIINEDEYYKHVVKGRVIKRVDKIENIDTDTHQVQVTSTVSNRVEINVFLPDGTYKCLA